MNPVARARPQEMIETGFSTIDGLNTLVKGQKLPIFSCAGLPSREIAAGILEHARSIAAATGAAATSVVVFVALGLAHHEYAHYRQTLERMQGEFVAFINLAQDPVVERLLAPRFGLTVAEYLAFDKGMHILVILTDMTNYCEALREVSSSKGEIPSRKGFPGYMYSDLATLFERAGVLRGHRGSLTQLSILTMPADDIGHPIPDLTGYITEGQIVLSRELDRAGVYPPVNVLPSLSRLMKDGTGKGYTHPDHPALASQLYAAYARATQARLLASVVGEDGLSDTDRRYLAFGTAFERTLISQVRARTLEESMTVGWDLLRNLPIAELSRLSDEQIAEHLTADASRSAAATVG